jgi:formylglycine-generating enzyme required for sulfatase activity
MSKVFISYRRDDSADVAGRIYDRLIARFGTGNVFKDVDSIPLGIDFRQHLTRAVIGRDWLRITNEAGQRRLDDPRDFVRIEIEAALQRDIPVIPLLVQRASMPAEEELPESLRGLAYRNGIAVRADPDFHRDMDRLIGQMERLFHSAAPPTAEPALAQTLTNNLGMRFVLLPKGTFWMGGGGGKPGDRQVQVAHEFYLGVYPVTQGQWHAVMGNNPSWFSRTGDGKEKVKKISDADLMQFPVEAVSWWDVQVFAEQLNNREKIPAGWLYRLPTETEWEYACRGGASSKEDCAFDFYLERPTNDLSSTQANFNGRYPAGRGAKGPYLERSTKVGSYPPNLLGIHDLHGNVWEWTDSVEGTERGIRGGSWYDNGSRCRTAYRRRYAPSNQLHYLGFRLALSPPGVKGG